MKTKINRLIIIILSVSFFSCEDILEKDITDDLVQIIYPQSNSSIYSNVVNFQWNNLTGASKYRIQILDSNSSIVLDSLVTQNNLSYPLLQGSYQWRVRAENYAYTSTYSNNINFSVFQTNDLTNQQVILTNPSDNFYTNNSSIIVSWQNLPAATSYSFELVNVTNGETIINQQSNLLNNNLTINNSLLAQDAEYRWKIKAVNSSSETVFFARKFMLDRVNPNQPTNLLPANNSAQTSNQQVNFSWNIQGDTGIIQSPITYQIEFSNDSSFSSTFQTSNVSGSTFQQSFVTTGDYYWRIKAKDQAGNFSVASNVFKFTIN